MGDLTKHFSAWEFECGDNCGLNEVDKYLLTKLEIARQHAGIPFTINSGVRCPRHNKAVGGVANSSHLKGLAVDIRVRDFTERFKIVKGLLQAQFRRIKLGRTFIHCDVDEGKVQEWFGL